MTFTDLDNSIKEGIKWKPGEILTGLDVLSEMLDCILDKLKQITNNKWN